jgi:hypothetical protein
MSRAKARAERNKRNAARWDVYRAAAQRLGCGMQSGFFHIDQQIANLTGCQPKVSKWDRLIVVRQFLGAEWKPEEAARERRERKVQRRAKQAVVLSAAGVDPRSNEFLQTYEWRRLRMVVLKKRGARCECCGASPRSDKECVINVDHIKPRRLFPALALEETNLQVMCNTCNHGKGNWDQTDWRAEAQREAEQEERSACFWSAPKLVKGSNV